MKACRKCGHDGILLKESGPHIGEYCSMCGAWIKWVPKGALIIGVNKKTGEPITTESLKEYKQKYDDTIPSFDPFDEQELKEPSPYDGDDTDDYFDSINIHSLYDDQDLPWED